MATTNAHLVELSDDKRQLLETWLVEFDLSWDESRLAQWVHKLPARGDCLRRPALIEMVKIDLEHRWQRGQRAVVEGYLKALPELGAPDRLPADLILAEYEARQHCGAPADLAEFARRFPNQADELRRLVTRPHDDAPAGARTSQDTLKPGDHGTDHGSWPSPPRPQLPRRPGAAALDCPTPLPGQLARGDVTLPEKFGRYRILRELGRGSMGTVYLAHDSQLERPVALKVPLFTAADGPSVRQRFLSEGRAAATIHHANICPVYDVGEIDGIPYLTMAYLQGQPLTQLLEGSTPLPEQQAASLVRRLTVALQAAHERGIIHRDLKPSNIIIDRQGEPVILDFGLARRLRQDGARLTQFGQPVGTPAYMSPEQVVGAVQVMGPGCDIYALGVILYQLLTGRLPFEGAVADVLSAIVTQQPDPPSKHRPGLDPRLEAVCLKALSKVVADRYASMRDFGAALAGCLACDPPPAAIPIAPNPAAHIATARTGHKALWLLVGGGAAAFVGAAALALVAGVIIWFANSKGTIRIELEGPPAEIEVQVDGERIDSARLNESLRLPPGKHHLMVTGKKLQTVNTSFTVARGDNPTLRVQITPLADAPPDPAPPVTPRRRHDDDDDKERKDDRKERKERKERKDDGIDD
jgi:predicted Ser/Thr protein kinase